MRNIYFIVFVILVFSACEEAFLPDVSENEQEIIVEGHIEKGDEALPPYVLLSRSLPFFGSFEPSDIAELQIDDASVYVNHMGETYPLQYICLSDLPPEIRQSIAEEIALIPNMNSTDFCIYIDIGQEIPLVYEEPYHLSIILSDGDTLQSSTIIPEHVPIDSFRFTPPPGQDPIDTLARLLATISDPAPEPNYYRYLTAGEGQALIAGFGSVTDDAFFNGQSFEFPLQKAIDTQSGEDIAPEEFGLYERGDTIRIKWINIDREHFEFWNTFEFNLNNQGPFSTYTRVSSNVSGSLGIWGGYSSTIYTLVVPEEE
jgi:hypothetical protein